MVWHLILTGVATYYSIIGVGAAYAMSRAELADKSTEKINSMKDFRDASKLKKALYVLVPGIYFAVSNEKQKRVKIEQEFMEKYKVEPILH